MNSLKKTQPNVGIHQFIPCVVDKEILIARNKFIFINPKDYNGYKSTKLKLEIL